MAKRKPAPVIPDSVTLRHTGFVRTNRVGAWLLANRVAPEGPEAGESTAVTSAVLLPDQRTYPTATATISPMTSAAPMTRRA